MLLSRFIVHFFLLTILTKYYSCSLDFNYHNYTQLTQVLQKYANTYPTKTYLYSIGQSVMGRQLWVLALSDSNPDKRITLRPEAKFVGNMHGNEPTSKEVLLHLIDYMLTNQSADSSVDFLMKNTRIHIFVSMNPDGYENSFQGDCYSVNGRYNQNGYDLNRNFPDLFNCNGAPIQVETKHVENWLENNYFLLSANFHSGSVVANYPYDNYRNDVPGANPTDDNDLFMNLAKTYSFNHDNMRYDPCGGAFTDGITNGARWYPVLGGMQDYNYWYRGCYELTIEITCCKFPNPAQLPTIWKENQKALISYLMQANTGIKGIIQFFNNQPAVNVSVQFDRREPIFKTNSNGEYFRLLLPGRYLMKILINCNQVFATNVTISNDTLLTVLNITLNQQVYTSYIQNVNNIDKNALFCTLSRQPVKCSNDTFDLTTALMIPLYNYTYNNFNLIKSSLRTIIALILTYLIIQSSE